MLSSSSAVHGKVCKKSADGGELLGFFHPSAIRRGISEMFLGVGKKKNPSVNHINL